MPTYEVTCAPVKAPDQDETHYIDAEDPSHMLTENFAVRPGTFVKSYREVPSSEQ
jgi:hypothetical protein